MIYGQRKAWYIERYKRSTDYTLSDVYNNYSSRKENAFKHILYEMYTSNGCGLKILTHCNNFFTCAYLIENGSKIVIHTPTDCTITDFI